MAPKTVEVSPNRTELMKICSLFNDNGINKNKDPASRGPNPATPIGIEANKKIPGTNTKVSNIFKFIPIECKQIQKLTPKSICEIKEIMMVLLL